MQCILYCTSGHAHPSQTLGGIFVEVALRSRIIFGNREGYVPGEHGLNPGEVFDGGFTKNMTCATTACRPRAAPSRATPMPADAAPLTRHAAGQPL